MAKGQRDTFTDPNLKKRAIVGMKKGKNKKNCKTKGK